jgi:hypothetical protein
MLRHQTILCPHWHCNTTGCILPGVIIPQRLFRGILTSSPALINSHLSSCYGNEFNYSKPGCFVTQKMIGPTNIIALYGEYIQIEFAEKQRQGLPTS